MTAHAKADGSKGGTINPPSPSTIASRLPPTSVTTAGRPLAIADSRTYLPGDLLVKMDIATMATSLEGRSPLLDQNLIEFVTHLPTRLKLRGGESKVLLRRLMKGVLPERVINRPKMGFGVPVGRWMRGPMRTLVEDTLLAMPDRSIVDRDFVHRLAREHLSGRVDHTARLWSLLMLELWFIHVVGGGPGPAGSQDTYRVTTTPERSTG